MTPTDETPDRLVTTEGLTLVTENGAAFVIERPSGVSAEDDASTP